MAMQPRTWMTSYLFSAWILHFLESVSRVGCISPEHRHLLILDGHNSDVTLEVAVEAKKVGLDMVTLPSHTSHALQPLDVAAFKPFKQRFREYRDLWTSQHLDQPATKQILAQWISLALGKALSHNNIEKGFSTTSIYPLNRHAVDKTLTPSETFGRNTGGDVPTEAGGRGSQHMESAEQGDHEEDEATEGGGEVGLPPI